MVDFFVMMCHVDIVRKHDDASTNQLDRETCDMEHLGR